MQSIEILPEQSVLQSMSQHFHWPPPLNLNFDPCPTCIASSAKYVENWDGERVRRWEWCWREEWSCYSTTCGGSIWIQPPDDRCQSRMPTILFWISILDVAHFVLSITSLALLWRGEDGYILQLRSPLCYVHDCNLLLAAIAS